MASILLVDDDPENLELLEAILAPTAHQRRRALGGREALRAVQEQAPDLVLLDLLMAGVNGFEVCEMLRAQETTARIPILVITGLDEVSTRERVLALGADDYLAKPIRPEEVLVRVEALLSIWHLHQNLDRVLAYLHELEVARHRRRRQVLGRLTEGPDAARPSAEAAHGPVVLLVDDEELSREFYGDLLVEHGFRVIVASSGAEALAAVARDPVQAVLLDVIMPGMSGLETLEQLRRLSPDLPVLILTAHPTSQRAITALKFGAFDFIIKGLQQPELVTLAVRRAVHRHAEVRHQRETIAALEARIRDLEAASPEHSRNGP